MVGSLKTLDYGTKKGRAENGSVTERNGGVFLIALGGEEKQPIGESVFGEWWNDVATPGRDGDVGKWEREYTRIFFAAGAPLSWCIKLE